MIGNDKSERKALGSGGWLFAKQPRNNAERVDQQRLQGSLVQGVPQAEAESTHDAQPVQSHLENSRNFPTIARSGAYWQPPERVASDHRQEWQADKILKR